MKKLGVFCSPDLQFIIFTSHFLLPCKILLVRISELPLHMQSSKICSYTTTLSNPQNFVLSSKRQ
jgi:hypothetical protein